MLSLLTLVWLKLLGKSHLQQHCESNQHFELRHGHGTD